MDMGSKRQTYITVGIEIELEVERESGQPP